MRKSALLKRAAAAAALSGALTGFAAGVADAAPSWGPRCQSLHTSFTTYYNLASAALAQGDMQAYRTYDSRGDNNYNAYVQAGCN